MLNHASRIISGHFVHAFVSVDLQDDDAANKSNAIKTAEERPNDTVGVNLIDEEVLYLKIYRLPVYHTS